MGSFETDKFLYLNGIRKYLYKMTDMANYGLYVPNVKPDSVESVILNPNNKDELKFACKFYELTEFISKNEDMLSDKKVISFDNSKFRDYVKEFVYIYSVDIVSFFEHYDEMSPSTKEVAEKRKKKLKNVIKNYVPNLSSDEYKELCCEASLICLFHNEEFMTYIYNNVKDIYVPENGSSIEEFAIYAERTYNLGVNVGIQCLFDLYFAKCFQDEEESEKQDDSTYLNFGSEFLEYYRRYIKKIKNERKRDE